MMVSKLSDGLISRQPFAVLAFGFWFLAAVLQAGCYRQTDLSARVSIEAEITPQPVAVGPASLNVKLADAQGRSLSHATLTVEENMSHPGMSPIFTEATELPEGRYRARLEFQMAGDWVVSLHFKLPGGQRVERQMDIKNVRTH